MHYLIHSYPDRRWYVEDYMIPSMIAQGIPSDEIEVWMDEERKGNLVSCLESFEKAGKEVGATWHLQDDLVLCRNFYERTKAQNKTDIVCGFCCDAFGPDVYRNGKVKPHEMWWSFQCIQIPNDMAAEFVKWFYEDISKRDRTDIQDRIRKGKSDDWFWRRYVRECQPFSEIINLMPNLVQHVDYLLGGSLVNPARTKDVTAKWFKDQDLVRQLENELVERHLIEK